MFNSLFMIIEHPWLIQWSSSERKMNFWVLRKKVKSKSDLTWILGGWVAKGEKEGLNQGLSKAYMIRTE